MASYSCWRCHRTLSDPQSVELGIGPVCRQLMAWEAAGRETPHGATVATLPFDPETMDIVCERYPDRPLGQDTAFNISQRLVRHSSGMEWGYMGSGPSDFALNILALFIGQEAAERGGFYHKFKARFVATLPREGGTIRGDDIRAWIREQQCPAFEQADLFALDSLYQQEAERLQRAKERSGQG